eukprot:scaffold5354_cov67-Phaeocystis_antarctica.AAC.8
MQSALPMSVCGRVKRHSTPSCHKGPRAGSAKIGRSGVAASTPPPSCSTTDSSCGRAERSTARTGLDRRHSAGLRAAGRADRSPALPKASSIANMRTTTGRPAPTRMRAAPRRSDEDRMN